MIKGGEGEEEATKKCIDIFVFLSYCCKGKNSDSKECLLDQNLGTLSNSKF